MFLAERLLLFNLFKKSLKSLFYLFNLVPLKISISYYEDR
jgi:hypothetical protein